jgi:putative ABC transport system permease protein
MLKHYLVLSLKVLLRRKFFTLISIFGISFTLLVLMVVTAMLDHRLAPMAPETRQELTLVASEAAIFGPSSSSCCGSGFRLFDRYAANLPGVERLSLYTGARVMYSYVDGRKIELRMKRTDDEFWKILDFTFLEGRPYSAEEVDQAAFVAVINRATREKFFTGLAAEGRSIEVDGQRFRVIGVVENVSAFRDVPFADIWTPYTTAKSDIYKTGITGNFNAMVLASNSAALSQIRDEFNARLARMDRAELPDPRAYTTIVAPFETKFDALARGFDLIADRRDPERQGRRLIATFGGFALLFVLLPTVNLVNINTSRILERASEIGIRKAFGASSGTLVGQFIVENVILTMVGGLVGLLLSLFVLRAINESGMIAYSQFGLNLRVFGYGLLLALAFGVVSGVYPAWRMSRLHPVEALRGGERR